jgi:hypothetical protein
MPDSGMLERLFGELATADLPAPAPASVVARGRQRRRRARLRALTAVAAVAVLVAGVTQVARNHEGMPATARQQRPAVCAAAPDAALNAQLRRALPASQQQSVSVIGLSANQKVLYVLTNTAGFHGIAAESVATGAITQRMTPGMPSMYHSAQGGLGPDGDVVFTSTFSSPAAGSGTATVAVWSPRTISWSPLGQTAPLEPAGEISSALSAPVFAGPADQLVAWEAQDWIGDSLVRQIVEADLRTGVTDVVATGYVGAPVFVGGALVWPVAGSAGGPSHLVAANASTFPAEQRVAVPLSLRKAGAAALLVSSGGATAYASTDRTRLFYSPSLSQPARQVLVLPPGNRLAPGGVAPRGIAVGPGYLAWNTSAGASFVASAKTLAATRISDGTASWGVVQGFGGYLLASKSAHPESASASLYLLSGSMVAGQNCAQPRRTGG